MTLIRPGPLAIPPNAYPGGVVIHIYAATEPPRLLLVRRYQPGDLIETAAEADADAIGDVAAVCLVAYNGDTGDRYDAGDWI